MSTSDSWASGVAYERYMGRWSRPLAREFLDWLCAKPASHWLDVGCGTGALSSAICDRCAPESLLGCDPSEAFVAHARANVSDARASFVIANADALPTRDGGFDAIVSGLVLNFLPDPKSAVAGMRDRLRPGGTVAAYVWDYASGLEFLRNFWDEASNLDPRADSLDEGKRFPLCQESALVSLFRDVRLEQIETRSLEVPTEFADFEDYWTPFLGGTGPAPSYVASLAPTQRESLKEGLRRRLAPTSDGRIRLRARAWAVRGVRVTLA